jgi:hypothetical protein
VRVTGRKSWDSSVGIATGWTEAEFDSLQGTVKLPLCLVS